MEVVSQTPREAPEEGQGQRMTLSPQVECIVTPVTRRTSRQCRYIRGSRGPGLSPGSRRSGSIFTKHLGATNWTWSSFSRWWPPRLSLTQPPLPGCRGNEIVELMNGQCVQYTILKPPASDDDPGQAWVSGGDRVLWRHHEVPEEERAEREKAGDTRQSKWLWKSFNPGLQSAQIGSDRAGSKDLRGILI